MRFFPFSLGSGLSAGRPVRLALAACGPLLALQGFGATPQDASAPPPAPAPFRFDPGAEVPALLIPRDEELVYRAYLEVAITETHVGKVVQTCKVETLKAPLIATAPVPTGEAASIALSAEAEYLWMDLESRLEARILPQAWPRLLYTSSTTSSQTRKRELWIGTVEGAPRSSFRSDTSKGVPEGSPRRWKEAKERPVPAGSLDMISAVFMTRAMMREQRETLSFPLVDKDRVWLLTLKRGAERRMELPAGTFDVVEVLLEPAPYPDEKIDEDKLEQFEGVFGIRGTIHLWVERKTGIAVRIQGEIPIKVGSVEVDVELESFRGTPPEFAPLAPEALVESKK